MPSESGDDLGPTTPLSPPPLTDEEHAAFLRMAQQMTATSVVQSAQPSDPPVHTLPLRQYLESSILPLLLRGLEAVAVAKPRDPLEFLAAYLLSNNPVRQSPLPVPPCAALSGWLSTSVTAVTSKLGNEAPEGSM